MLTIARPLAKETRSVGVFLGILEGAGGLSRKKVCILFDQAKRLNDGKVFVDLRLRRLGAEERD
jgi:hypothetical protein